VTVELAPGSAAVRYDCLSIGGQWRPPVDPAVAEVVNPATARVCGEVAIGGAADVDLAVDAARTAGLRWSRTSPQVRAQLLEAVAERIRLRRNEFAELITLEMGAPADNARDTQTDLAIAVFESYAKLVNEFEWEEVLGNSLIVHEPIGVVAAITPWNYPLYLASVKIAAALAGGCTVVFKPSIDAPLDGYLLVSTIEEVARECGAPAGLVNLVPGHGSVVGAALVAHPHVAAVSLTGSTNAGRQVSIAAAHSIKRVGLELGGKSAAIIVDDVTDLTGVLSGALADVFFNSGQTCTSCARILVPACRYDEAVELAADIASRWTIGDPRLGGDHIGPVATRAQYESVIGHLDAGLSEGARLVVGGVCPPDRIPAGMENGFWILPTVFADVDPKMTIATEEIFGPVALLISYEDDDDAVRIANSSIYGLSGAVWSEDNDRALALARRLETGRVVVNGGPFNVLAPTGGYKQSGNGRELGIHGLREFLEVKNIQR
jgi:aldehyde dehydrogenase (NAD+)